MEMKRKKPLGFYFCSLGFTLERFAFYSAKWLIAVFVVASVAKGGLNLTPADAAKMSANLVAFTYLAPLFGAYISDNWIGARYLVPIGMSLMGTGYLVGWQAKNAMMVNIMIVLVSLGTGLFKPQTNAITGRLFKNKEELDGAFSEQYSFVNVGSFLGTTIIGTIALSKGYQVCFLICAIVMFIDTIMFIFGWRYFGDVGKKPFKFDEKDADSLDSSSITQEKEKEVYEKKPLTGIEKQRVMAIILVSLFSVLFWVFWYLAYMPVYYHWGNETAPAANWMIGNFQIPTSWFDSLNGLACIVLGPILGAYWTKKAKSKKGDFNIFQKTALGMFFLGLSYVIFAFADVARGENQASILWLVAFGITLSLGEMVFSPMGNSFITKFAPPRLLSNMMAVWTLAIFFAGKSYGYLYEFTLKFPFAKAYFTIAIISIISSVILWAVNGKLNSLVREGEEEVLPN